MLGLIQLTDPKGGVVYASPEGAKVLRAEHGYTDAPAAAESAPAPDPEDPQVPPADDPPKDPPAPDEPEVKDPAAPRGNASRADWAAYAEQVGLQVADEDSREDIKSAVAALEQ